MEHLLHKLAVQLDAMDEASLMSLWDKYAAIVSQFEPSRRWEEAVLIFGLIQTKHWKNQLLNHQLVASSKPSAAHAEGRTPHARLAQKLLEPQPAPRAPEPPKAPRRATVIPFVPRKKPVPDNTTEPTRDAASDKTNPQSDA
ncbi:MAG TPA: hypothetical protein IAB01_02265 [Candidatus Avidesulfovibrio excrementigallinarum]|nr:hypothetical protein [Candidatus Avidesulfovibrio excrementigallinarum]